MLSDEPLVTTAARMADRWGGNPLDYLNQNDFQWLVLVACAKVKPPPGLNL